MIPISGCTGVLGSRWCLSKDFKLIGKIPSSSVGVCGIGRGEFRGSRSRGRPCTAAPAQALFHEKLGTWIQEQIGLCCGGEGVSE